MPEEKATAQGGEEVLTGTPGSGEPGGGRQDPAAELADLPIVTSDAELSFDEALALTSRRGGRLVLLMGETHAGKTTIIVELWTLLVGHGPIAGYQCGGSRTVMALEERAFHSRMAAGLHEPETPRTQINENEGLLHMRIARPDEHRVDLLFADFAGERFTHIREGVPLLNEFPWATRVDRFAVLIDGFVLSQAGTRELAVNHARRQIYALQNARVLSPTASLIILLAKDDAVDDSAFDSAKTRIDDLVTNARDLFAPIKLIRVAARPMDGGEPRRLDELLEWICEDDPEQVTKPYPMDRPSRAIARLRASL